MLDRDFVPVSHLELTADGAERDMDFLEGLARLAGQLRITQQQRQHFFAQLDSLLSDILRAKRYGIKSS
jgi:hypothetical protein